MSKQHSMLKALLITIGFYCILIPLIIFFMNKKESPPVYDVFERIRLSPCVKFEKISDVGTHYEPMISNSGTLTLGDFFSSLLITEGDSAIGDVLYKITFNCREVMPNGEEIIILVGKQALSIDGVIYVPEDGVVYKGIKDAIHGKWKYFDKQR